MSCLLEGYTFELFMQDCIAGISVGVIALPLAMAFSIAAGLDPEYGIYTACIAGFLNSLFGGSRFLIGGPTGAYVLLIYAVYQEFGYPGLQIATIEAAALLIILGVLRMGNVIRFIPYPVIVGFTGGIAIAIAISQLKDFFGLSIPVHSIDPIERLRDIYMYAHTISWSTLLIGIVTFISIIVIKKQSKQIPAFLTALTISTGIVWIFQLPVVTIEDKFGLIPSTLPMPIIPDFSFELMRKVFPHALGIALLGAIESLLCAVIADSLTGTTHKSNGELVAQGIANIGSALFHGIPSTGAIARTTASIQLGAKTPIAGIVHAITLLLLILFLAPIASMIPLSALAAVLIFIAWNMIEFNHMKELIRSSRTEAMIMTVTLCTTLFVDLNTAVELGVLLSVILFVKKSSEMSRGRLWPKLIEYDAQRDQEVVDRFDPITLPHDISVYELEGPFFFAVSDVLNDALLRFDPLPRILIVRMRSVPFIDSSGIQALKRFFHLCTLKGVDLYFSELQPGVQNSMVRARFFETISHSRIIRSIQEILE